MKRKIFTKPLKGAVINFFIFVILTSCTQTTKLDSVADHPHGLTLQRFEVVSTQFENIVHDYKKDKNKNEDIITILYLNLNDSAEVAIGMTPSNKRNEFISKKHIFESNNRIVGFIVVENDTLLVLSNISNMVDFSFNAYKFIRPTTDTQYFDYIYFPDDLYCLTDKNGIPCGPSIYDPYYWWYIYRNNEFLYVGADMHGNDE